MRIARPVSIALLAAIVPGAASPQGTPRPAAAAANDAIRIPFETYKLANGLTVILSPDRSVPRATVDVWYHVGSKNEAPGKTGFAHLFEHVMFTGSGHAPYPLHDNLTGGVGGSNNGSTTEDRTNYYETIPSNYLESSLWLEADRMGFLLDKLDSAKFVAQRDIVQNERRQSVENQPYGRFFELLRVGLYPDSNPYSWPVVGYMSDLQRAGVEDVKSFFRLYYAPSNAYLAVTGDFETAQVKQWIAKYFGDLPRGAAIKRPAATPPRVTSERRLVYEDRVQIPRLYIAWPTVGVKHDDSRALDVLTQVLTGSRTARLTKALVYDAQSAASVQAFQNSSELLGEYALIVVPRPNNSLTSIETAIDSVLQRIKREGPTAAEMERALARAEFAFVSALETNFGKAETLLDGAVFHGDPGQYRTEHSRIKSVRAADVKRVANTYLGAGRVVLSIVPTGKVDMAARPELSKKVTVGADGGHYTIEGRQP